MDTTGIYKLVFTCTDKVYVGQSIHIEKRFKEHINLLRAGKAAYKLQQAYNLYGEPSLVILEITSLELLDIKEIEYIKKYNSLLNGFNSTEGGFSSHDSIAPWAVYSLCQIKQVFQLLVHTELDYSDIESIVKVNYSTVRDIANAHEHLWLSHKYPRQYALLLNKKNTRLRIKYSKELMLSILEALVDNRLLHKEIASKYNTTINVVQSISKFKAHKWLEYKHPNLYQRLKNLKNTYTFSKTSKYTKEDMLEVVQYFIEGRSFSEIESITSVPISTQKNLIYQNQHKWLTEEYPDLVARINNIIKNKNKSLIFSKYTKEEFIESINQFIQGISTKIPKRTITDIIRKGTHGWVQQEYPELYTLLKDTVNGRSCSSTS